MHSKLKTFAVILSLALSASTLAANTASDKQQQQAAADKKAAVAISKLEKPLYSAFTERYILDDLKQLRIEMAELKVGLEKVRVETTKQITDREINAVSRSVSYATDAITYFFYLIAAASSIFVLVGWSSIRDIKERVHKLADEEITKIVDEYESRLDAIEEQMKERRQDIENNREEIELTQEIQSLWLRASRENNTANKIIIFDNILTLRPDDVEALTQKADAVLELGEPKWAINLCNRALEIDPEFGHAFYQLACAYTALDLPEEAIKNLSRAVELVDNYRDDILHEPALDNLHHLPDFQELVRETEEADET